MSDALKPPSGLPAGGPVAATPPPSSSRGDGVLSGILGAAVRDRRVANPALGMNLPPLGGKRRRYLNAAQVEALADAAGPGRAAVLVLSYCGLRWSELAALRVRNSDLLRRRGIVEEAVTGIDGPTVVWGTPKTHSRRSVPLPRFLVDELAGTAGSTRRHAPPVCPA